MAKKVKNIGVLLCAMHKRSISALKAPKMEERIHLVKTISPHEVVVGAGRRLLLPLLPLSL